MIIATAPGRAGIIGNPIDGYGGNMIACAIKNRARVTIEKADQLVIENAFGRKVFRWKSDFENKGDYFDVVRSILRYFKAYDLKARITIHSDIPGSGRACRIYRRFVQYSCGGHRFFGT